MKTKSPRLAAISLFALALLVAPLPARAQTTRSPRLTNAQLKINLAWQIALDSAHFSPGVIDAKFGKKSQLALAQYAAANFPGLSPYDRKVFEALHVDVKDPLASYVITDQDAASVGPLPDDWNEKSKLEHLNYTSLADCLSEKFHCTQSLLQALNPSANLTSLNVGQTLTVPHIHPVPDETQSDEPATTTSATTALSTQGGGGHSALRISASYITIDLTAKIIRAYDKADHQIALFWCSVAKDKAKLPAADTSIKVMAKDPDYTFNPSMWPDVHNVDRVLRIPPGPRNPVGLAWIGLNLPGYGIHGTPKPELIGKTGSHGCFRLTNWDALTLYSLVHTGMTVKILNPETQPAPTEAGAP